MQHLFAVVLETESGCGELSPQKKKKEKKRSPDGGDNFRGLREDYTVIRHFVCSLVLLPVRSPEITALRLVTG